MEKDKELKLYQKTITYTSVDGQEITLSPEIVKKYLVHGRPEYVTFQEIVFFLNLCKSARMNPFIRDCYFIKYTQDEVASPIVSIDFLRKRAKAQPDCQGWQKGIIVRTKDGQIKDTYGLLLEGEELLGGWFECQPKGWLKPFRLEVNLKSYIKKTREGKITRFWSEENQPTMIAKVAEAQGLRTIWAGEFQNLYVEEEAPPMPEEIVSKVDKTIQFDERVSELLDEEDKPLFTKFLEMQMESNKVNIEELKNAAIEDFDNFWLHWERFKDSNKKEEEKQPKLFQ